MPDFHLVMTKLVFLQANFLFALFPSNYHSWKCIFFWIILYVCYFFFSSSQVRILPSSLNHTHHCDLYSRSHHALSCYLYRYLGMDHYIFFELGLHFFPLGKSLSKNFLKIKNQNNMTPERTSLKLFLCGFPCKSFFQQFLLCRNFFWPSPPPLKSDGPFCMFCES